MIDYSIDKKVKSNTEFKAATISENTGAIFSILTESVYSMPRLAGVREIISNALDATVRAKSDRPILVTPPNSINPTFSVRDYGRGLSHEEIYTLYTSLGSSSKKEIENEIGFFGIGALSPLAYVESFNVTSFRDGEASIYSIFMGPTGIPQVAHINTSKVDGPNGLLVSYNIKRQDINPFINDIYSVLKYIEKSKYKYCNEVSYYKDDIKNDKQLALSFNDNIFIRSKSWNTTNGNILVMGGVAYEYDPSYLNKPIFNNHSIVIEAPIGAVSVQASREKLKLNAKTNAYIKSVVEFIYENIEKEVQKQVDEAADYWTALNIVSRMNIIKISNVQWRGKDLCANDLIKNAADYFDIRIKRGSSFLVYEKDTPKDYRYSINHTVSLILDDSKRGALSKIKTNYTGNNIVVFIEKSSEKTKEFIKEFGNLFHQKTSTLPEPPKKVVAQKSKKKTYVITDSIVYYQTFINCTKEFTGDYEKFEGFYVICKGRSIVHNGQSFTIGDIYEAKKITKKPVIVIDWETKDIPPKAINFIDYIKDNYVKLCNDFYNWELVQRIKVNNKLALLYNVRADFKKSLDSIGTPDNNINTRCLHSVAVNLGLNAPKQYNDNNYDDKINTILWKYYPILQVVSYNAYEEPSVSHLKKYLLDGDQTLFENIFTK